MYLSTNPTLLSKLTVAFCAARSQFVDVVEINHYSLLREGQGEIILQDPFDLDSSTHSILYFDLFEMTLSNETTVKYS